MGCVQSYFRRGQSPGVSPSSTEESNSKVQVAEPVTENGKKTPVSNTEEKLPEEPESNDTSYGVEATAVRTLAATTGTVAILATTAKAKEDESDTEQQENVELTTAHEEEGAETEKIETQEIPATSEMKIKLAAEEGENAPGTNEEQPAAEIGTDDSVKAPNGEAVSEKETKVEETVVATKAENLEEIIPTTVQEVSEQNSLVNEVKEKAEEKINAAPEITDVNGEVEPVVKSPEPEISEATEQEIPATDHQQNIVAEDSEDKEEETILEDMKVISNLEGEISETSTDRTSPKENDISASEIAENKNENDDTNTAADNSKGSKSEEDNITTVSELKSSEIQRNGDKINNEEEEESKSISSERLQTNSVSDVSVSESFNAEIEDLEGKDSTEKERSKDQPQEGATEIPKDSVGTTGIKETTTSAEEEQVLEGVSALDRKLNEEGDSQKSDRGSPVGLTDSVMENVKEQVDKICKEAVERTQSIIESPCGDDNETPQNKTLLEANVYVESVDGGKSFDKDNPPVVTLDETVTNDVIEDDVDATERDSGTKTPAPKEDSLEIISDKIGIEDRTDEELENITNALTQKQLEMNEKKDITEPEIRKTEEAENLENALEESLESLHDAKENNINGEMAPDAKTENDSASLPNSEEKEESLTTESEHSGATLPAEDLSTDKDILNHDAPPLEEDITGKEQEDVEELEISEEIVAAQRSSDLEKSSSDEKSDMVNGSPQQKLKDENIIYNMIDVEPATSDDYSGVKSEGSKNDLAEDLTEKTNDTPSADISEKMADVTDLPSIPDFINIEDFSDNDEVTGEFPPPAPEEEYSLREGLADEDLPPPDFEALECSFTEEPSPQELAELQRPEECAELPHQDPAIAATTIQAGVRGYLARKHVKEEKIKRAEEMNDEKVADDKTENIKDSQEAKYQMVEKEGNKGKEEEVNKEEGMKMGEENKETDKEEEIEEDEGIKLDDDSFEDKTSHEQEETKEESGKLKEEEWTKPTEGEPSALTGKELSKPTEEAGVIPPDEPGKPAEEESSKTVDEELDTPTGEELCKPSNEEAIKEEDDEEEVVVQGCQEKEEDLGMEEAATKIQAGVRGYLTRKHLNRDATVRTSGEFHDTIPLSPLAVGSTEQVEVVMGKRKEPDSREEAATRIQSTFRGYKTRRDMKKAEEKSVTPETEPAVGENVQNESATKIQAGVRGYLVRKRQKAEQEAATKIQAGFRGFKVRQQIKQTQK